MKIRLIIFVLLLALFNGCNKDSFVPVPSGGPSSFMDQTYPLLSSSKLLMEGVYNVVTGVDFIGNEVVLKWNRTSLMITNKDGKHFILEVGHLDSVIFVQGYWRDGYSDATGLASFYIAKDEGGTTILTGNGNQTIIMRGAYSKEGGLPDQPLILAFERPFSDKVKNSNYYILGHRGGGRTSDRLPVSENSIAMINYTEKLGSTGIEVDVRLTSDGVTFLYHDSDINTRLTQKGPLAGPIENYTWKQLSTFVRLIHGERIPTLEEALIFTIDSTLLRFVYLDMKANKDAMAQVVPIQKRMLERAQEQGRDIIIVVGIPSTDVLNDLMTYPDYQNIPSLCELTVDDARLVNSRVWGPRWTLGTQNDLVQQMHSEGRLAVCWTIDTPVWIQDYIENGFFDGLLTNYPYVVAYYHYIQ
ncbi:MAG: glycerophosphodiester phosphodiesterase [bacterium]